MEGIVQCRICDDWIPENQVDDHICPQAAQRRHEQINRLAELNEGQREYQREGAAGLNAPNRCPICNTPLELNGDYTFKRIYHPQDMNLPDNQRRQIDAVRCYNCNKQITEINLNWHPF